jgi:hypothetical protein
VGWGNALNLRVAQIDQNSETDTSLDFAKDCVYITLNLHARLSEACAEIGRMIGYMLRDPAPFLISVL